MNTRIAPTAALLICAFQIGRAQAADINLFDFAINIDGSVSRPTQGDPVPSGVNLAGFDSSSGLGTVVFSHSGAGAHYFSGFFDHEIDESVNTFFNELGSVFGVPGAGQTWEVDEPGFAPTPGDIYLNFSNSSLDNSVGFATPDDVSVALAYNFLLGPSEVADIQLTASLNPPGSGFYLMHSDPDSTVSIFYSGSISISEIRSEVPELPNSLLLLSIGVLALLKPRTSLRPALERQ